MRSVRGRLLLNSILVTLVAILAVGMVTLLLVDAYFTRQEQAYLRAQAGAVGPLLATTLDDPVALRRMVALSGLSGQLRVQVLDARGELLADSGQRRSVIRVETTNVTGTGDADFYVGVVIDDSGRIQGFSPPMGPRMGHHRPVDLGELTPLWPDGFGRTDPPFFMPMGTIAPLTAVSDTRLRLPLMRSGLVVGYMDVSEGPAVGDEVIRSIRRALLGGSAVALLVAVVVGLLSARQVTRPLLALGDAADRMAGGAWDARAPGSRLREYDRLAQQFNAMADRLAGTIDRLQAERERLRQMIMDAGHELRTPLTALKTFNELLAAEVAEPAQAAFVAESGQQIAHLQRLTGAMLDLSRLEARLSGTDFVTADLRGTVEQAVHTLRPLADARQHALTLTLPDDPLPLAHDAAALQQAVGNLLDNAIRYTPPGGTLGVTLARAADGVHIAVADNGGGISAEAQPHLFERFYRGDPHRSDGSGLGLAICREIVAIHGGRITVASAPGAGSTFTIILPATVG